MNSWFQATSASYVNKANHDGAHEDRADSQGRPAASEEAHHSEEAGHLVLFGLQEEGALCVEEGDKQPRV